MGLFKTKDEVAQKKQKKVTKKEKKKKGKKGQPVPSEPQLDLGGYKVNHNLPLKVTIKIPPLLLQIQGWDNHLTKKILTIKGTHNQTTNLNLVIRMPIIKNHKFLNKVTIKIT